MKKHCLKCMECGDLTSDPLIAANPFDEDEDIIGCPHCKSINSFEKVCDAPYCTKVATGGYVLVDNYMMLCREHFLEYTKDDGKDITQCIK